MLDRDELYDAGGVGAVAPIALRAGPLDMEFEPETGFLRYVRLGDREAVRAIYAAVRDHRWRTIPSEVRDVELVRRAASFELTFEVLVAEDPVDFRWTARVEGGEDGTVRFAMDGEAHSEFARNRIGFCVLHPPGLAGAECELETTGGARKKARFPERIARKPVFQDLAGLRHAIGGLAGEPASGGESGDAHEFGDGAEIAFSFEGEVFETEDQRNWTDGSFKTYCTPVGLPAPVALEEGDRVRQTVIVGLERGVAPEPGGREYAGSGRSRPWVRVRPGRIEGDEGRRLPRLGVELVDPDDLGDGAVQLLDRMELDHVRLEVRPHREGWRDRLSGAASLVESIDLDLELALFLDGDPERRAGALADALEELGPPLARVLVYREGEEMVDAEHVRAAGEELSGLPARTEIVAATNRYFTELNAHRPDPGIAGGFAYSVNPQVHAFDNRSMVETLQAQPETVRSARSFLGDCSVMVGPVTLRPRFNPDTLGPGEAPADYHRTSENVDPRQRSLFAAAWTVGSLAALAEGGCDAVTYFEAAGLRGVLRGGDDASLPEPIRSAGGRVVPVYHVLADAAGFERAHVLPARSDRPLEICALMLEGERERRVLLANLTDRPRVAEIELPGSPSGVRVRRLDETTAEEAIRRPEAFMRQRGHGLETEDGVVRLSLLPYGVARIDARG